MNGADIDFHQFDILANKLAEFFGRYFSESFKTRHFGAFYLLQGIIPRPFAVAVPGFFGVPHPKQRRFKDIDMASEDHLFEVGQEIGQQQITDMIAVIVGVRRDDNFVESQIIDAIFYAKRHHQIIKFFIFIYRGFGTRKYI